MAGLLKDARQRMLKSDARVIPVAVDLFLAPLEAARLHGVVTRMPEDRHGLDFSVMRGYAVNQIQIPRVQSADLLGEPSHLIQVKLDGPVQPNFGAEVTLEANREGTLHALVGWFEAELAPGIRLGNKPPAEGSHWGQAVFPLERSIPVSPGTGIGVRINTIGNGTGWRWTTEVSGERFDQTTLFGFPHNLEAHRLLAASARPHRAALGDATLFVLFRLDGQASIDEIAEQLEHESDLFPQTDAAARFVRDVAERYGA